MKRFLFFLIAFFIGCNCSADILPSENLLDPNNAELTKSEVKTVFTGTPAILIESQTNPLPQRNQAEQIAPPQLTSLVSQIPIKTFFGHKQTAAFIDHTTDFNIFVSVLDDKTIHVEEQIQFISTNEKSKFQRTLLTQTADTLDNSVITHIQPLSLMWNHSPIPFRVSQTKESLTIAYPADLPRGAHRFTLKYLVSGAIRHDRTLTDIFLSLTGSDWATATERFSLVIFFPKKTTFYTKELLFGSNNQSVPDTVSIKEDATGTLLYQLTRPLPAFADVKIHLVLDKNALPPSSIEITHPAYSPWIMGTYLLVLILYTGLSVLTARYKKWKNPLLSARKINLFLWETRIKCQNLPAASNKNKLFQFISRLFSFIRFNVEYIIGLALLITLTYVVTHFHHIDIGIPTIILFVVSSIIALIVIDRWGTRTELQHLADTLQNTLLSTPQGLNLAQRDIPTYYTIACHFGFGDEWKKRLIANNPNYRHLFLTKENNT